MNGAGKVAGISDAANLRKLAAAMILQAVRELAAGKDVRAIRKWMKSDDFKLWALMAGVEGLDPNKYLYSNLDKAYKRFRVHRHAK